jgi:type IV secretory pathway VirB3-like protein
MSFRRLVFICAVALILVMVLYMFLASFMPTTRTNSDVIKSVLPFLFTAIGILIGFYWGASVKDNAQAKPGAPTATDTEASYQKWP